MGGLQAARTRCGSSTATAIGSARSTTTSRARRRSSSPGSSPAMRPLGARLVDQRVVIAGAGAAGIGIARLLRLAMIEDGASRRGASAAIAMVDSRGLVHDGRADLDDDKGEVARPVARCDRGVRDRRRRGRRASLDVGPRPPADDPPRRDRGAPARSTKP